MIFFATKYTKTVKVFAVALALLLFFALYESKGKEAEQDTCKATVIRVIDGDTFICVSESDTLKVRALGYDAFETSHRGGRIQRQAEEKGISIERALYLGRQAKRYAQTLLLGKEVLLCRGKAHTPNKDFYGRLLRYVVISNNNLETLMNYNGYTATYHFKR